MASESPFVGRGSEEARWFLAAVLNEEATAALVKLPKMLRKIPMLIDGGLVLKLMLVLDDRDCIVAIEPDAMNGVIGEDGYRRSKRDLRAGGTSGYQIMTQPSFLPFMETPLSD